MSHSYWHQSVFLVHAGLSPCAPSDEAAVEVMCRLEHSQKEIVISGGVNFLPGTQSKRDSAPERTWSSIYTTEYNRTCGTIVLVSKQKECE